MFCIRFCARKLCLDFFFVFNSFVYFRLDLESTFTGHVHGKVNFRPRKRKRNKKEQIISGVHGYANKSLPCIIRLNLK